MAAKTVASADFSKIWKAALAEFQANTNRNLANEDELSHLQSINELLEYLTTERAQYEEDSSSSKFTSVVKSTLGPLKFFLGTAGKAAGDMFPGGAQVLSALSIFVEAGRAVTESFEAVAKLFERIANFTSRMQTVSEVGIPPKLVPIYQTMLVSLLNICGLSIQITRRYLATEKEEVPDKSSWYHSAEKKSMRKAIRKLIRAPQANVAEYLKQLTGGNSKINDAVANLNELVVFETSMMQANTLSEVMRIKAFTMNLQGLTIELGKTISNAQSESNFRLSYIQQSQDRIEENTIDVKKGQSQANTKLDWIINSMEKFGRISNGGTGRQQNESQETKDSVSKELKRWEKLAAALEVEGVKESNKALYERIQKERVPGTTDWITGDPTLKSWIQGETPFVVMSGDTGNGKTFIASRIVDQLITSKTDPSNPDKAMAYFFCRKGSRERSSITMALKTMAYDIASSDQLFAKYLMDLVKDRKLQSGRAASKIDSNATTIDSPDSADAIVDSAAGTSDQTEAMEVLSAKFDSLLDRGPGQTDSTKDADSDMELKLHRVSTAVLQDKPLDDDFEETTVWDVQRHWENLFVLRPQSFERHVYLIIDGLDECDETEAIALCAAVNVSAGAVSSRVATKVHVLLLMNTDRETLYKSDALTSATIVRADSDTISADIDRFVRHRISSAWKGKLVRRELRQESRRAVIGNCDINFLKASLLVNEVTSFNREDIIRDTLSKLPSLAKTVQSAMLLVIKRLANQLSPYDREDFHDILAWVSCAHRELSLGELDALLTLRKPGGARILDLEEKLRETFASLFSVSGEKIFEQKSPDELMSSRLGFIKSSLVYEDVMSIKVTIADPPESPIARTDGLDEAADPESSAVRRATLNLRKSDVSLSHTMIAEQIQKHIARAGLTDFTTVSMQAMVLLRCMETLCDDSASHDEQSMALAKGYCGIYLPEHLQSVEPSDVIPAMKIKIAKSLITLLRTPAYITRWVESSERYLADDLLGKPDFPRRVLEWLQDGMIQSHMSDDERDWHSKALKFPISTMFEGVAKAVARRWLACLEGSYAYADYYGFLKTYQDTKDHPEIGRAAPEVPSRALRSASKKDILQVAESTGLQQNCRYFQRLGSTIRIERNDYNDTEMSDSDRMSSDMETRANLTYKDAIEMYDKALEIDSSDGVARSGLALTLAAQEKYDDAAREANAAVEIFSAAIQNGEKSPNTEYSLNSYKLDIQQEYASYCIRAGNFAEGFRAYQCATRDLSTFDTTGDAWDQMALTTAWYFFDLISKKQWDDAEFLLATLNSHPQRSLDTFHVIYRCIAYNEFQLLQFGYHTRNLTQLTKFMNHALSSTARQDTETAVANVVNTLANILLRLDGGRVGDAVTILEALVGHSLMDDFMKSRAERELARHFLTRMLHEREDDRWRAAAENVDKLIRLANGDETAAANSWGENKDCCRILAACYRINGLHERAMDCVRSDVSLGIDLLSDTDPDNDLMAWHTLMDSLLAIGDVPRAVAAVNMVRNSLIEDPAPSGGTSNATHPDRDNSAESDDDTRAGASNEEFRWSRDASNDDVMPLGLPTSTDRLQTADSSSVGPAIADQAAMVSRVNVSDENPTCNESRVEATVNIPDGIDQAQESASPDADESKLKAGYPFFRCDGCCFDTIPNNAPMWRCSYCIADFCERCHRLIKDSNMMGWNVCDALHNHVSVPEITKRYPKDMIRVEGEDKSVTEWVQELREEWKYFKPGN